MIRGFVRANKAICDAIERRLPTAFTASLLALHVRSVAEIANAGDGLCLIDGGGGRNSPYHRFLDASRKTRVVALDVSEEELRANNTASFRIAADLTRTMPIRDAVADIVTTRSVLEHLSAPDIFVRDCHRVLKPGGHVLVVFPCRYAPFAVLNRLLPGRWARFLLYGMFPEWQEKCGFLAYYNKCYYTAMAGEFDRHGFKIERTEVRYYQSIYYKFFVPLYLLMLCYDFAMYFIGFKNLACQIFLVARKTS